MTSRLPKILLLALLPIFTTMVAANPPPALEGKKLYVSYCLLCHGADGKGAGPLANSMRINPADLSRAVAAHSDLTLAEIITGRGQPQVAGSAGHKLLSASMPEWKNVFDRRQVESLIAYLRFISRQQHDLVGDPESGLELYQTYCQVCHGVDGDGIMTKLIGVVPMDHTDRHATNRLDNRALMNSILEGKGRYMPAWRGILTQADVEALVSYIRLLSY